MVCFEDMKEDLAGVIRKVAKLMGEDFIASADLKEMCRRGSFEYMRKHKTKFDDHFVRNKVKKQMEYSTMRRSFPWGKSGRRAVRLATGRRSSLNPCRSD